MKTTKIFMNHVSTRSRYTGFFKQNKPTDRGCFKKKAKNEVTILQSELLYEKRKLLKILWPSSLTKRCFNWNQKMCAFFASLLQINSKLAEGLKF